ncbi:MAG TPA: hypothetical protein VHL11_24645, partial [Phototrophicaceae bacterium]|nr:hypothetical protein [Phototrophicaceae bacterium]
VSPSLPVSDDPGDDDNDGDELYALLSEMDEENRKDQVVDLTYPVTDTVSDDADDTSDTDTSVASADDEDRDSFTTH